MGFLLLDLWDEEARKKEEEEEEVSETKKSHTRWRGSLSPCPNSHFGFILATGPGLFFTK